MSIALRLGGRRRSARNWPTDRRILLHVGCGPPEPGLVPERFCGPEWHEVRLDIDPGVQPDIVANITDMSAVDAMSVDAIWSSHNVEHVFAHEVPIVFGEFFRVLRPSGIAMLEVPDLQAAARLIAEGKLDEPWYRSASGVIAPIDMVYGFGAAIANGQHYMAHRTGFTRRTLERRLRAVGFTDVEVTPREGIALSATARRPAAKR